MSQQFDMFAAFAPPLTREQIAANEAERLDKEQKAEFAAILDRAVEANLADKYSVQFGYRPTDSKHSQRKGIWALPSRAIKFPFFFRMADGEARPHRIVITNPFYREHPYVQEVATFTGLPVIVAEGSDLWGCHSEWHHAVDLISLGLWRECLDTIRFTTTSHVAGAVTYALRYRANKKHQQLSLKDARTILLELNLPRPTEDECHYAVSAPTTSEKNPQINFVRKHHGIEPWVMISGIESKIFCYDRGGLLSWSTLGVSIYRDR